MKQGSVGSAGKAGAEKRRIFYTSLSALGERTVSGAQSTEGEAGTCSVSGAGGFAEKTERQWCGKNGQTWEEYESSQNDVNQRGPCNDLDFDLHKNRNTEQLSFFSSALSNSSDLHEPQSMCDRQCRKNGCKYNEITTPMVDDDGKPHNAREG